MAASVSNAVSSLTQWTAPWRPALLTFVLTLSVLKGLRMPNRWSVTHYLFGYEFGFVRRGLFGELLQRALGPFGRKYFVMAAVALALCALFVYLCARLTRRLPATADRVTFALVFFASPAIAMAVHLGGYLEQVGYVWLLALMLLRRWRWQWTGAMAAAAVLPFVHEASLLWIGPLTMLLVVLSPAEEPSASSRRFRAMAAVAAVWILATGATVWLGELTTTTQVNALRDARTASFDIRPRQDAFATLSVPFQHARDDMRRRWAQRDTRIDMVFSLMTFAPAAILLMVIAARHARAIAEPAVREVTAILVGVAVAAPLLLHLVAWDRHRWNALMALNAGLAALMLLRARPTMTSAATPPIVSFTLGMAVALWSLGSDPTFFDAYSPAHPPFAGHVLFLVEFLRTGDWTMWIPAPGN